MSSQLFQSTKRAAGGFPDWLVPMIGVSRQVWIDGMIPMRVVLRCLAPWVAAFSLGSAAGQDGLPPRDAAASTLMSVVVRQQPAPMAEPLPAAPVHPHLALAHDEDLIGRVLARPQPANLPRHLDPEGEQVHGPGIIRFWGQSVSLWEAPAYCHRPLYFEDENLERHGRSFGLLQPAASVAHFTGRGLAWPYLAGAFPHQECVYPLGRQQPGTYTPYHWYRPPVSARGALYEAAVATGLSYIVP